MNALHFAFEKNPQKPQSLIYYCFDGLIWVKKVEIRHLTSSVKWFSLLHNTNWLTFYTGFFTQMICM